MISARPTLYFYNPNIDTAAEFEKRLREVENSPPLRPSAYRRAVRPRRISGVRQRRRERTEGGSRCANVSRSVSAKPP
ncbi:MAG: epoxyqueuosine reductase QueH [Christensenellales bacterium]